MATKGWIYDKKGGTCLARFDDGGKVFDATRDGRQIATIDQAGNINSLQGELVGHLEPNGSFDGPTPKAFTKLLASHGFRIGQTVVVPSAGFDTHVPRGPFTIVRLLPSVGDDPQYRVVSTVDRHERAVLESQIKLLEEEPMVVAAPPARQVPGGSNAPRRPLTPRRSRGRP